MSFITKRERVFNDIDLYDLPARNEGKLKAYASCTDARAWSHFCSDKSEHLVEIIKRNNEVCRPKYVPTEAIVNTLLAHKQQEIARLKRKIEEFEQLIAAYDELDLSCEQKCEIAKAHAAIKEAYKDLNELCFDLDLSSYTGIDSEDFETGKSRGDELSKRGRSYEETPRSKGDDGEIVFLGNEWLPERESVKKDSKEIQAGDQACHCDATTNAVDPRIQEMQDVIIAKDAKLAAMANTQQVIENDVLEPYCIYAHIYTALVKIIEILCQNEKYKLYLNMMTAGKDTRCIDIKGKILFKLKVLEKFSLALLAPCSQTAPSFTDPDCSCYRVEIISSVETAYALTSAEAKKPIDSKRTQLVADILDSDEMLDILHKHSKSSDIGEDDISDVVYNIDQENMRRLKSLQQNYDELMNCYEDLKHEKDCLLIRCQKYEELEKEFVATQNQLREYNSLWTEKEHYKKRSHDLDDLKEQYLVLCDETSSLESALKAEKEINDIKNKTIEELRCDNVILERKLNEASSAFNKELNGAQCKIKEYECKIMCQGEQIKSLSLQIDKLLEQESDKPNQSEAHIKALIDEVNTLKEEIKSLQDALHYGENEKQQLQNEYHNKLNVMNAFKIEIEDWKDSYEKSKQRNEYLEKYTESFRDEVSKLMEENKNLLMENKEKSNAIDNLVDILKNKSFEINTLTEDIAKKNMENKNLYNEIRKLYNTYKQTYTISDSENIDAVYLLDTVKKDSQELLDKVKNYDRIADEQRKLSELYEKQCTDYNEMKFQFAIIEEQNKTLQNNLEEVRNDKLSLIQEIQKLNESNKLATQNLASLQKDKDTYQISLEQTKKENNILKQRIQNYEELSNEFDKLKEYQEILLEEKNVLQKELSSKILQLNNVTEAVVLTRKQSQEFEIKLKDSENYKKSLNTLHEENKKLQLSQEKMISELDQKKKELDTLSVSNNKLKEDMKTTKEKLSKDIQILMTEVEELKKCNDELIYNLDIKAKETNNLYNELEIKKCEIIELSERFQSLEVNHKTAQSKITDLERKCSSTHISLKYENEVLLQRLLAYQKLETDFDNLKNQYNDILTQNRLLLKELEEQKIELNKSVKDNEALYSENHHLLSHIEDSEKALIETRSQLISNTSSTQNLNFDILKQMEEMKNEKKENIIKIRNLLDKLEEYENIISELDERISARDDKISILENHKNKLQDEIILLHKSLDEVFKASEQMRNISKQKITQSLENLEAHHSRATHNMKMELAQLQRDNTQLEEKLFSNDIKKEETIQEKQKRLSLIRELQYEKEIIVTGIKQLETKAIGDSNLSLRSYNTQDILESLDRLSRYIDAKVSKSNALENALQKMQNSYLIVQNKADEAKKIVEKEKQKILIEKDEAIRDRINMEKQLSNLKDQLEKELTLDRNIIADLEAEILNQKLIYDKLNESTQIYISELKDEIISLKEIYQNSLIKIRDLEQLLANANEENSSNSKLLNLAYKTLQDKSAEIDILNQSLKHNNSKYFKESSVQVHQILDLKDEEIQVSDALFYKHHEKCKAENELTFDRNILKQRDENEIEVLRANVNPTFDFIRNTYLNYKLKNLSTGCLKQFSISCTYIDELETDIGNTIFEVETNTSVENINSKSIIESKRDLLNIVNEEFIYKSSSKVNINYCENINIEPNSTIDMTEIKPICNISNTIDTVSMVSTDDDLFVIYKDSNIKSNNKEHDNGIAHQQKIEILSRHSVEKDNPDMKEIEKSEALSLKLPTYTNVFHSNQFNGSEMCNNEKQNLVVQCLTDYQYTKNDNRNQTSAIEIQNLENKDSFFRDDKNENTKQILPNIEIPGVENDTFTFSNEDVIYDDKTENDIISHIKSHENGESEIVKQTLVLNIPKTKGTVISLINIGNDSKTQNLETEVPSQKISFVSLSVMDISDKKFACNISTAFIDNKKYKVSHKEEEIDNFNTDNVTESAKKVYEKYAMLDEKSNAITENSSDIHTIYEHHNHGNNVMKITSINEIKSTNLDNENEIAKSNEIYADTLQNMPKNDIISQFNKDDKIDLFFWPQIVTKMSCRDVSQQTDPKKYLDQEIEVNLNPTEEYEKKIQNLTNNLETIDQDYKRKIEAIKDQYDANIKNIMNDHNMGVKSIQSLHEETLCDIIKHHEDEVESLRSLSIEAVRKADKLEKEVRTLRHKISSINITPRSSNATDSSSPKIEEPRHPRIEPKTLTKTEVEAFNVKPKSRSGGPCSCALEIDVSDTIRNIFKQVDVDQKNMAEQMYLKYIANKIISGTVEALDCQELSFLHLNVCRILKTKQTKKEKLNKKISTLKAEVLNKKRHNEHNIAELDRQVEEERRRLKEVRDAVCKKVPTSATKDEAVHLISAPRKSAPLDNLTTCHCDLTSARSPDAEKISEDIGDPRSTAVSGLTIRRRHKPDSNRALAKLDTEERRQRKLYPEETPTRLRKAHDRRPRSNKK